MCAATVVAAVVAAEDDLHKGVIIICVYTTAADGVTTLYTHTCTTPTRVLLRQRTHDTQYYIYI